jgi:hypothetical protein
MALPVARERFASLRRMSPRLREGIITASRAWSMVSDYDRA